jgi:hypothetical protein
MKATVNMMDSQGHVPAETYFKNFNNVDASRVAQVNSQFVKAQDRMLDHHVKMA